MAYPNFNIRPLLLSEIDDFVTANIKAGFISSACDSIAFFKNAIIMAEYVGIFEEKKEIKGGIMVFRRWSDAVWVTNIFVDPSVQNQGVSTVLYKHILQYCASKKIKWSFCNPVNKRVNLLYQRWGILPINS